MSNYYSTIGGLINALQALDQSAEVYIDNRRPTALSSYRGYYDELAIERDENVRNESTQIDERSKPFDMNLAGYGTYSPGHNEVRIKADPTVADLVLALDLALGEEFEGYKGGQFYMYPSTALWVSEYGHCDQLQIEAIETLPGRVDLSTRKEES